VLPQLTAAEAAVLAIVLAGTDAALRQPVLPDERDCPHRSGKS
jgi:hypothetical protein